MGDVWADTQREMDHHSTLEQEWAQRRNERRLVLLWDSAGMMLLEGTKMKIEDPVEQLSWLARRKIALLKELAEAEQDLARNATPENYVWLRDCKNRLKTVDKATDILQKNGASANN